MKTDDFKNALRSYRWTERKIQELYYKIAEKDHELTGLTSHSVKLSPEQEKSSKPMPHFSGGGRSLVDRICELDELKEEYKGMKKLKNSVDVVLDRMQDSDRVLVIGYYCDRKSPDLLAERYGFKDRKGVYYRMNAAIRQCCS